MTLLDADKDIGHQVCISTGTDSHGNETFGYPNPPIPRKAIAIYPESWARPRPDPVDVETLARTMTNLLIDVPDATIFKKNDRILIFGKSFRVQNDPRNWGSDAPFGLDASMFGGTVHVERTT
jgi:hypothetical protein